MLPKELKLNDVVCYANQVGSPFADMRVVKLGATGVYLRRAFIDMHGDACWEEVYFPYEQNFRFTLVERHDARNGSLSCT